MVKFSTVNDCHLIDFHVDFLTQDFSWYIY